MRYKVKDLLKNGIKDKHGNLCPDAVAEALENAGIVSLGSRPASLDWDVVGKDAKGLLACSDDDASS